MIFRQWKYGVTMKKYGTLIDIVYGELFICYFIKNVVVSLERHHHFITPDQTIIWDGGTLKKHVLLNNLKIL